MIREKIINPNSRVLWITGLSGSGKSTIATEVVGKLKSKNLNVIHLDGDELREIFDASTNNSFNHTRMRRIHLAKQYSNLCKMIASQGITVVISTISLFADVFEWNRKNLPGYFEVYLKVPTEELIRRDPKQIYKRYAAGEISQVAGLDLKIDEPSDPDLVIEFDPMHSIDFLAQKLINAFIDGGINV